MKIIKQIKQKINCIMKKEEALKRLTTLEETIESATEEAKKLRKVIEAPEEPKNIMDRVKSYKDACQVLGIKMEDDLPYINPSTKKQVFLNAGAMLETIIKALNEGWEPNWDNSNECKYYPWFDMRSGFAFSHSDFGWSGSFTLVGSRLCFKSEALARYSGKQFEKIYKDYLSNKN